MQKAYSRINWKDEPSLDTPLGANNLNKMDSALDVIDNRVLSLYGYEGRVAQSEKNAKASEVNAKTSENNAKESEELAKQYMESAFDTTPEGYEQIVDTVQKMDIKESTSTTLLDSKEGGYKLLSMSGNSVQKTMSGKNLLSNNELLQGYYQSSDGAFKTSDIWVTVGADDYMKVEQGKDYCVSTNTVAWGRLTVVYYDANKNYVSSTDIYSASNNSSTFNATMSGYAKVQIRNGDGISVSNVQYIQAEVGTVKTEYEPYVGGIPSPNPDFPQRIDNVGDCVEMMQGTLSSTTGEWVTSTTRICSKNTIPCKSGDVVRIETESSKGLLLVAYYNEGGFVSVSNLTNVSVANFTVPTNVTKFKIVVGDNNGITPSTVGKISLTINGKYVVQIVEENKNLLLIADQTQTFNGILTTVTDNVFSSSGTATRNGGRTTYFGYCYLPKGTYYLSTQEVSGVIQQTCLTNVATGSMIASNNAKFTLTEDTLVGLGFNFTLDVTYNCTFKIQLERGEVMTEWVEPKKTVTTVLLNEPLRDSDVISRTEVVRKRATKKASELSWGASTNNPHLYVTASFKSDCICTHFTDTKDSRINGDYYANMYLASGQCSKRHGTVDRVYFKLDSVSTLEEWKSWIAENDFIVEYELETPIVETLDSTSQIALNSLETFDSVTYINIDSRTQPKGIKGEYGTSKVGARTIKNELKNDTLEIKYNELVSTLLANNEVAEVEEVLEGDEE